MHSIDKGGSVARAVLLLISQTKPGPNIPAAVARKVERKEEGEEKDVVILEVRVSDMGVGVGERVVRVWWVDQAIEAVLKRGAWEGERAWVRRRSRVGRSASFVAVGGYGE